MEPITVPCKCPPKPNGDVRHASDTITLKERMDFRSSVAIRNALGLEANDDGMVDMADALAILTERFIYYGIASWSFVDAKNQPVPVSREAITRLVLEDIDLAMSVADVADDLYRMAVMGPLGRSASKSSLPSPTTDSTSAATTPSTKPRRPSKRSSTTTSPTGVIVSISPSPDGVSNSLPSSESAAS